MVSILIHNRNYFYFSNHFTKWFKSNGNMITLPKLQKYAVARVGRSAMLPNSRARQKPTESRSSESFQPAGEVEDHHIIECPSNSGRWLQVLSFDASHPPATMWGPGSEVLEFLLSSDQVKGQKGTNQPETKRLFHFLIGFIAFPSYFLEISLLEAHRNSNSGGGREKRRVGAANSRS